MPVQTLPDGHIWLKDAFERAWSEIEGGEPPFDNAPIPNFGPGWETPNSSETDAKRTASRERVERQMREALSSSRLRAMIRDPQTGEPGEVPKRQLWIDAPRGFKGLGLDTEVHHLTCPGPKTDGRPVSVLEKELRAFIASQKKEAAPKSQRAPRQATKADIDKMVAHFEGRFPGVREAMPWWQANLKGEVSQGSFKALLKRHTPHAPGRRPKGV
jgi:hypothetical protein